MNSCLVENARRMIRASIGNRAKERLVMDFIHQTDLDTIRDKASVIAAFFHLCPSRAAAQGGGID